MEMLLNEYDMVVGARFEKGTIQDYIDDKNSFGLIRIENSTANWFLYNDLDCDEQSKELYESVIKKIILFMMNMEKRLYYLIKQEKFHMKSL